MKIIVNGKKEKLKVSTITELVEEKELDKSGLVVEHNGKIIKQEKWSKNKLQDGDKLELLSFVGGG